MSKILTRYLPEEQRKRLHPDFLKNEQQYRQMRDQLLKQYPRGGHRSKSHIGLPRVCRDQWVALSGPNSSCKRWDRADLRPRCLEPVESHL